MDTGHSKIKHAVTAFKELEVWWTPRATTGLHARLERGMRWSGRKSESIGRGLSPARESKRSPQRRRSLERDLKYP